MSVPQTKPMQRASVQTLAQCVSSDTWKTEIQKVLPKELLIEAFLRVTRTVASEAKFGQCDPRSFLGALLKCARAGLVPDGIHAHLIPFGNQVNCIFDWKGVVDLASRNGIEVVPKLVCEFDDFSVDEDDGTGKTVVHHRWGLKNRGTVVGYYCRARGNGGVVDYEFMTRDEVEATRQNYSNAKNSKAWEKSFDEMAKKTVIKRHSKRWPISQEARAVLNDDDDGFPEATMQVSKPLFNEKRGRQIAAPKPETKEPEPETMSAEHAPEPRQTETVSAGSEPETEPKVPSPDGTHTYNPLKALRNLAKMGGIKEGELLDWWSTTGATQGDVSSLEEVSMQYPDLIKSACENWPVIDSKIKELQGKAGGE